MPFRFKIKQNLNLYYFISKRINLVGKDSFTYLVIRIATISIAIGLAVMIASFAILSGFQEKIQAKIFSFGSHIQVTRYDISRSFEESPISKNTELYTNKGSIKNIAHIQVFSQKPGLLKTDDEVSGVIVKGIGPDFNLESFKPNIIKGDFISFSDSSYSKDILISKKIANKLKLNINDTVLVYFVQNPPRYRKLEIKGIYETGLEEFDEFMIIGDIRLNQRLNSWPDSAVGGYEIFVKDFERLDETSQEVFESMDYELQLQKITDKYMQIFDWLALLNRNVIIFLVLILFVAAFNMVSTLLIMIMERTNMIGILKAVGANNKQIRMIFIYNGITIILKGILWGNIVGLGFCLLQYYFKIIPLDPENYYMTFVPIQWNWPVFLGINLLTLFIISLVLFVPVIIISNIKPVKSIKFD